MGFWKVDGCCGGKWDLWEVSGICDIGIWDKSEVYDVLRYLNKQLS